MSGDSKSMRLLMDDLYRLRDAPFYGLDPDQLVASIRNQWGGLDLFEAKRATEWIRRQLSIGFADAEGQARIDRVLAR